MYSTCTILVIIVVVMVFEVVIPVVTNNVLIYHELQELRMRIECLRDTVGFPDFDSHAA